MSSLACLFLWVQQQVLTCLLLHLYFQTLKDVCSLLPKTHLPTLVVSVVSMVCLIAAKELNSFLSAKLPVPVPMELITVSPHADTLSGFTLCFHLCADADAAALKSSWISDSTGAPAFVHFTAKIRFLWLIIRSRSRVWLTRFLMIAGLKWSIWLFMYVCVLCVFCVCFRLQQQHWYHTIPTWAWTTQFQLLEKFPVGKCSKGSYSHLG